MKKINYRRMLTYLLVLLVVQFALSAIQKNVRFAIKLEVNHTDILFQRLKEYNYTRLYKITPTTYIFEYIGDKNIPPGTLLHSLLHHFKGEIVAAELVRGYGDTFKPATNEFSLTYSSKRLIADPKQFIIKVRRTGRDDVFKSLRRYKYRLLYTITPETSIFEYEGHLEMYELHLLTLQLQKQFRHKIVSIEELIVYENTIKPEAIAITDPQNHMIHSTLEIDNHYGMGISKVHERGYTGNGAVVAVTDVGIDTDLLDLHDNIDKNLSFNFINNSRDVAPEYFHHLQDAATTFTAHGDQCASIIGSIFGNGRCSFGIAYKATIVGLKIFMVTLYNDRILKLEPVYSTRSDIVARALVHNLSEIDIFSNAWAPTKPFAALDLPTKDAIKYGSAEGRRGLGTIHIVPAGLTGNELANNIYTIAVNGVGRKWSIPVDSSVSASVLTCGLSDGSNITAKYMVTISQKNKCVTNFKGVSAATAQIAAIIALALEANPRLTLRQLKHLLVQASEPNDERNGFTVNAAGHLFHMVFGFGLLNADRLVSLAQNASRPAKLLKRQIKESTVRTLQTGGQEVEFCYGCNFDNEASCLDTVEHVLVKLRLTNLCKRIRMVLISPSGTKSVLISFKSANARFRNKKIQLTSVHFWDEITFGVWRLLLTYPFNSCDESNILHASLTLYGTKSRMSVQNRTEQIFCTDSTENSHPTDSDVKTSSDNHVSSIFIHIDLSNLIVVIIGLVILGAIIFVIGRLPHTLHYIGKH